MTDWLPGEHFRLTFTVPEPLRPFLRRHQKIGYGALFEASSGAIKALVVDPRHIGGDGSPGRRRERGESKSASLVAPLTAPSPATARRASSRRRGGRP